MKRIQMLSIICFPLVACDISSTGDNGELNFTPTECGVSLGCDFDDSIAVGGTLHVTVDGGADTYQLDSSDNDVVRITGDVRSNRWELLGVGIGRADLIAYDDSGEAIDWLTVEVDAVDTLAFDRQWGTVTEHAGDGEFDVIYTLKAGEEVGFDIRPMYRRTELMGHMQFVSAITPELNSALDYRADLARGELSFRTFSVGEHAVSFAAEGREVAAKFIVEE